MLNRILLGLDSSDSGPVALSFAMALAGPDAQVRVVHVNEFQLGGRGLTVETADEATALVTDAVTELHQAGVKASGLAAVSTCFGVADHLVAEAGRWSADVIVLGSCRRRGMRRVLSQGVRERVLRLSSLPVLTAPAPLKVGRPELAAEVPAAPPGRGHSPQRRADR
ncbi:MAG TPA: universal stress protein [Streptosporangiaceae bacterium]|nr:universal stress protein [Streptosporangiaceae bacterium]